jgi:hypothetical protein
MTSSEGALQRHILVVDGVAVGGWRLTIERKQATVEIQPLVPLTEGEWAGLDDEAERLGRFLELPVSVSARDPSGR